MVATPPATTTKTTFTTSEGEKLVWDSVTLYGLNPDKKEDQELVQKLRNQFQAASMACYDLGYKQQCPGQWDPYLKHPDYWFERYAQYLQCDEQFNKWSNQTINANDGDATKLNGVEQVRIWSTKLSLLKHQAQKMNIDSVKLNIDVVVENLMARIHQKVSYAQILDADLVKESRKDSKQNPTTEAFGKTLEKMSKEAQEGAAQLKSAIPHALSLLLSPNDGIAKPLYDYWAARTPGGKVDKLTLGQVSEGIETVDFSQLERRMSSSSTSTAASETVELVGSASEIAELNKTGGKWLGKVIGGVELGFKYLFKVAAHVGALWLFYSILSGDAKLSSAQMGSFICATVTEGLTIVGGLLGKLASVERVAAWALGKGGAIQTATAWLTKTLKPGVKIGDKIARAFVGDLTKVLKLLGIAGCVFNLIVAYWGMNAAGDDDDPHVQNERYFSRWYFALGVIEGVALVGGIIAEIIGCQLVIACAGPLALVVGAIALTVALVQMIFFPTDKFSAIRHWLKGKPTEVGSYDPKGEVTGDFTTEIHPPDFAQLSEWCKNPKHQPKKKPDEVDPPRLITPEQEAAAQALSQRIDDCANAAAAVGVGQQIVQALQLLQGGALPIRTGELWAPLAGGFQPRRCRFPSPPPTVDCNKRMGVYCIRRPRRGVQPHADADKYAFTGSS